MSLTAAWSSLALKSRPCEIQTAALSRSDVTADKRMGADLAVAPGVFGDVSDAPNRPTTHMTTAGKAQKRALCALIGDALNHRAPRPV